MDDAENDMIARQKIEGGKAPTHDELVDTATRNREELATLLVRSYAGTSCPFVPPTLTGARAPCVGPRCGAFSIQGDNDNRPTVGCCSVVSIAVSLSKIGVR